MKKYINNYLMLGDMFLKGQFAERDPEFAVRLYKYVFDDELRLYENQGMFSDAYGKACVRLGECYLFGFGKNRNVGRANYYFSEAEKHISRQYWPPEESPELLQLLDSAPYAADSKVGERVSKAPKNSVERITDEEFTALIAAKLPKYRLKHSPEEALSKLRAENPKVETCCSKWFSDLDKGVREGDPKKMYCMAKFCLDGDESHPINPELSDYGSYLYHKSLLAGCYCPLTRLGYCYQHGVGVKKDYAAAILLYSLSNRPHALGNIGVCHANGQGVRKNAKNAYRFFVKALLLEPDRGGVLYDNMTVVYRRLKSLERDTPFMEYCKKVGKKGEQSEAICEYEYDGSND